MPLLKPLVFSHLDLWKKKSNMNTLKISLFGSFLAIPPFTAISHSVIIMSLNGDNWLFVVTGWDVRCTGSGHMYYKRIEAYPDFGVHAYVYSGIHTQFSPFLEHVYFGYFYPKWLNYSIIKWLYLYYVMVDWADPMRVKGHAQESNTGSFAGWLTIFQPVVQQCNSEPFSLKKAKSRGSQSELGHRDGFTALGPPVYSGQVPITVPLEFCMFSSVSFHHPKITGQRSVYYSVPLVMYNGVSFSVINCSCVPVLKTEWYCCMDEELGTENQTQTRNNPFTSTLTSHLLKNCSILTTPTCPFGVNKHFAVFSVGIQWAQLCCTQFS